MSKSAAEVERVLQQNKRVDEALGKPPPQVFYTDIVHISCIFLRPI
jgi:hypothetical protein